MKNQIFLILMIFSIILVLPPAFAKNTTPYNPTLSVDKISYTTQDTIIITGNGGNADNSGYTFWFILTGPDKIFRHQISTSSDENGNFYYEIDLAQNNYYTRPVSNGTYTIVSDMVPHGFNPIDPVTFEIINTIKSNPVLEEITLSVDKESYNEDDVIILTGTLPKEMFPTVFTITVEDPYGKKINSMNREIDPNGNFGARFSTNHFLVSGNYTIEVDGKDMDEPITVNFEYKNPNLMDVRVLDTQVQRIDTDVKELQTGVNSLQVQFNNFQTFVNQQLASIFNMFNSTVP